MTALDTIRRYHDELAAIRHDLHAHPELGMTEQRTAEQVAKLLESWGIEVHRGVGRTGVVGVLRAGNGPGAIGLRADMDALPIPEATGRPYASGNPGVMHACGHDGHTTMLLGAARYLAETRGFNGTVNFIFQPGEEGAGGALAMLEDKLFERFPCERIFGIHNRPGMEIGKYAISPGASSAGGAFFDIAITGRGAHGARPEESIDPVLVACHIGTALQSLIARNLSPWKAAVLSVTKIEGGAAYNVIPGSARLAGTARAMQRETLEMLETGIARIAANVAAAFGATATSDFRVIFAPLVNDPGAAGAFADTAAELVGEAQVDRARPPGMGSEDFSFMMEQVPGAYLNVGNGKSAALHNAAYDFNDAAIPYGAALFARLIERELPRGA